MPGLTYGSVCSGIEAASVAWEPLGFRHLWFSEIEPFPCAVLAHRYPSVPNLGNMLAIADGINCGEIEAPDILVGGTPCQAFSVAGKRGSLSDERGNLSLAFVRLADAIDRRRRTLGLRPCIVVWENVPGVLSVKDNAFGCFLAGLAGEVDPLVPPGKRWTNAGCVSGPERSVVWRTLDAQWFGLAQRRRRVFVVASAGTLGVAEVLLEFEGVRRDTPPLRGAREEGHSGDAGEGAALDGEARFWNGSNVAETLTRTSDDQRMPDKGRMQMVPGNLKRGAGADPSTEVFPTLRGAKGRGCDDQQPHVALAVAQNQLGEVRTGEVAGTLNRNSNASGRNTPMVAIGVDCYNHSETGDVAATIGANSGGTNTAGPKVLAFKHGQSANARSLGCDEHVTPTLEAGGGGNSKPVIAFGWQNSPSQGLSVSEHHTPTLDKSKTPAIASPTMRVRRLTPRECERLQGFPDDWTLIPWRGKDAPDGHRYKAIGNSMAVPVVRWIGERIKRCEQP